MTNSINPDVLWRRYTPSKLKRFTSWLTTTHGKRIYKLFADFAHKWKAMGNDRCASALIVNRVRWEQAIIGKFDGYKICNDYCPMLARQLVIDDPTFTNFFSFHDDDEPK